MKYSDTQRIEKMCVTTKKLLGYLYENGITREDILASEPLRWTITTPLYNIGEHAYHLSEDFRNKYSHVQWSKIAGLRHRLVHDYENTNWLLICTILFDVLPIFLKQIEAINADEANR